MNTELPEPGDYYRPTRARELREKGVRREGLARACQRSCRISLAAALLCCLVVLWMPVFEYDTMLLWAAWGLGTVGLFLLSAVLFVARCTLERASSALQVRAMALDGAHALRYGSLPEEVDSGLATGSQCRKNRK